MNKRFYASPRETGLQKPANIRGHKCNYKHTCPWLMMSLSMRNAHCVHAVCTSDTEASLDLHMHMYHCINQSSYTYMCFCRPYYVIHGFKAYKGCNLQFDASHFQSPREAKVVL